MLFSFSFVDDNDEAEDTLKGIEEEETLLSFLVISNEFKLFGF